MARIPFCRLHTKGVVRQHASKKGSWRVLEGALQKVLRTVLGRGFVVEFSWRLSKVIKSRTPPFGEYPDLLFLAFLEKGKENHQKRNSWEREEKRSKKQGIPCKREKQRNQNKKARKRRLGYGPLSVCPIFVKRWWATAPGAGYDWKVLKWLFPPWQNNPIKLGVFWPHLPCEIAEANFRPFQGFSPDSRRLSIRFDRFSVIFSQFQSASISLNQF